MRLWIALVVLAFSSAWIAPPAQAQTTTEPSALAPASTRFSGRRDDTHRLDQQATESRKRDHRHHLSRESRRIVRRRTVVHLARQLRSRHRRVIVLKETRPQSTLRFRIRFLQTPLPLSGAPSGLRHDELAAHVQAMMSSARSAGWRSSPAGPSFFRVEHDFVSDVSFSTAYPFDTASFTSAASERVTK